MALSRDVMTDEQRKSVALEYLKAFDNGGVTSTGGSILDLFAEDAQVYFPKWGLANGKAEIGKLFGDVGGTIKAITHHYSAFNWIFSGSDLVVVEGTSHGEHQDGSWRAGVPDPACLAIRRTRHSSASRRRRRCRASRLRARVMPWRNSPATRISRGR
jgi:hypothetical protein